MSGRFLLLCAFGCPCDVGAQDLFLAADASSAIWGQRPAIRVLNDDQARRLHLNDTQREAADQLLSEMSGRLNGGATVEGKWWEAGFADTEASPLALTMLEAGEGNSSCLDGSPYGFYFRPAPAGSAHQKDWVLFLQGGGLCVTIFDCLARARSGLGSSKHWSANHIDNDNMLSASSTINPFWDFNHVWLPYCSGDTHTGLQTRRNAYGLLFAGAWNLEASVARLQHDLGLGQAGRVILSGGSAGGIGTHNNADWLQSALPSAKVVAMPMAGQFFPAHVELSETQILRVLHILSPVVEINALFSMVVTELWQSRLPEPCANRVGPEEAHRCWDASANYDHVTVPTLYVQNMFDQLQIEDVLLCFDCPKWANEYIAYFGMKMRETLGRPPRFSARRNSVWLQACYDHTDHLCLAAATAMNGQRLADVARAWFFQGLDAVHIDPCAASNNSQPCNQRCDSFRCTNM